MDVTDPKGIDEEVIRAFSLFSDETPVSACPIDTSRGDADFRMTFIVETAAGSRYALKLADNDFTFPEKIAVWERTVEEYRRLGYYCPGILRDKTGDFPYTVFHGHRCAAYMEEYAAYRPAEDRFSKTDEKDIEQLYDRYKRDIWQMTARVAAKYFDYSEYPSAYCLFETFCPSDKTDEVLENAMVWKECADRLPEEFREQAGRIWQLWTDNRAALEKVYGQLPTSVFQADLNLSNLLVDDEGNFAGLYDFNLCGRDVFLNYLIRETGTVEEIREALEIASGSYRFSETEKDTAQMLYRCLKPLWFTRWEKLKEAGNDREAIRAHLDETERMLTEPVDFRSSMEYTG